MIINLIKSKQMFSLALPSKVKGQYWVTDIDDSGKPRELISVEAIQGEWVLKSNKTVSVLNTDKKPVKSTMLKPLSFFMLSINGSEERVILFCESIDPSRQTFVKAVARTADVYTIGRTNDNNFCYDNRFVSGRHARISYDGSRWTIMDAGSTNGTYVNGYRVESKELSAGDYIYIMGLKIIVGGNFLAVNNPDGLLKVNARSLVEYHPQQVSPLLEAAELPEKDFYYRSPRFHREIEHAQITIDPPPQLQKMDTVPLALMLGPSMTMGMTSLSTGLLALYNVTSNGGDLIQSLPTLMMSVSMLLGTVLWPILTKKYEKKQKLKAEKRRQEKYLNYLDHIRDEIKRKIKEQSDILAENLVSPDECADRIIDVSSKLWERGIGQSDFMRLRLGLGSLPLDADVKYNEKRFTMDDDTLEDAMLSLGTEAKRLDGVPVSVSLVDNWLVGIVGKRSDTYNLLKSLILQTMTMHSYDDVKIVFITDPMDAGEWNFVRSIPHFWNDDKSARFFATTPDECKELASYLDKQMMPRGQEGNRDYSEYSPYYLIISTDKKLSEKCEALQRLMRAKENRGCSIIHVANALKDLPKETRFVIQADDQRSSAYDKEDTTGKRIDFVPDVVDSLRLTRAAQSIANVELDLSSQTYALPTMMTFLEMFNVGKVDHLNSLTRWKENNPTITLQTPIGVDSYGGQFNLDLHEKYHGPHGLVAGMTGSGKSEFIITYILSLAVNYHPDEVAFILIDYKGGGLAGAFEDSERGIKLPHLAGTITNLDGAAVKRSLISIQSELRRRQAIFNEARKIANEGTMDIYKYQQLYRDKVVSEPLPHLFIISDEFAELKSQQQEFMDQLISAARIGRSLGVHLILATQKPNGVVDEQIWSNSKFRVCLKVQDKNDSQDMIKRSDAAELSQTGRFYLQVGFNELFALGQSAWCGAEYIPAESVEKSVDNSIQVVDNLGRVMMSVKPGKKRINQGSKTKQIVAIVKYLSDLATEEHIATRPLWLDPIPTHIYLENVERKYGCHSRGMELNPVVGEFDDPYNQKQGVLTVPFTRDGNCLVYGATGNGKTTFLTTLCYSLLKNHSADEVNIYLLDFGAETLRAFEKAPQVGGVVVSGDDEKLLNFFKMLNREMENRKELFSEFGGDHSTYCRISGHTVPNIVVLLNNISGFSEQYEDLLEIFNVLSRDGVKYGIYFAVTAGATNAVRYKTQQNFKTMLTMQLNDATDYSVIVGKTEGLIPFNCKGRGLVAMDRVYEFQTAYCSDAEDQQEYLRSFSESHARDACRFAARIPMLPDVVNCDYVCGSISTLADVPVGIAKKTLDIRTINLSSRVIFPVVTQDVQETGPFVEEFAKLLSGLCTTVVVDAEQTTAPQGVECVTGDFKEFIVSLFKEMVDRNNTYKDAGMDTSVMQDREERVYIIVGMERLYDQLDDDCKEKLSLLLVKAEPFYKLHFVMVGTAAQYSRFSYEDWYKRFITGADGLWIGSGMADQYMLKVNKITNDLYEEVDSNFGYLLTKNRPVLVKLLSSGREVEAG